MQPKHYYQPVDAGLELQIGEKLARLRAANRKAQQSLSKSEDEDSA
jgi:hypothetical protein